MSRFPPLGHRGRRIFFWSRLIAMGLLAAGAAQLLLWNRDVDPRFFRFLSTPPGKALARVMNWPNLYDQLETDKALEDYTEEEFLWRKKIESSLRETWPTHTLFLTDGSQCDVQVMAFGKTYLQIQERFGTQGRLQTTLRNSLIREITPYAYPPPQVTWRDVRFQMEYPGFELTYAGHFTVLTDAPYYQVASSVNALEHLRDQFYTLFGPLIRYPKPEEALQLLFFTREKEFRRHQEATAPELINSVGYYSPLEDRMVLFNHEYSKQAEAVRRHVGEEVGELVEQTSSASERNRLRLLHLRIEEQLRDLASLETLATLRHEGAHHLAYTYGVHSWIHTENAWLVEGLATYFESSEPGNSVPSYVETLRKLDLQGRIPDLDRLMAVRLPSDFGQDLPELLPHEAYAVSWSLFRFCMEPKRRGDFFRYLTSLQDPEDLSDLMQEPRHLMLSRYLGMSPQELQSAWLHSLL